LTPSWAEEPFDLINARAETVREKRSFADAYDSRRCLVPADGFYEWVEEDGGKQPYRVAFDDDRPFAMAGLYERWQPPEPETTQTGLGAFGGGAGAKGTTESGDDRVRETFTVVTTEPNDVVAELHHRMAVILAPDEEERWLHGDSDEAEDLMDPYPASDMEAYPVSPRVNAAGTDGAELIEPIGAE
jgi:putative SOS response-associated peptidase YedK